MKIGIDMKYNYFILALAAAALFSCTGKESVDPNAEGELVTIRAFQEGATETRTTLIDGGTQVYWEPSDEIKVFFCGSGSRFISQNTSNADVAEFSGTMNVVVGMNEGASGSNTLWGLYPYRADATSEGESVTTTLPVEQTGRAGSFAKGTHITLAQSSSFDLVFYNVTGGIRFSLTQEGVKEVVFQGQNDEDIAGKVKLAFVDGVPAVQEVIEGQKSITLSAPVGTTFETGKWYYIVALPGTLSNGFKMTFNTETQYTTLKSSGSKTIKRGIFGSLADADEDLIYKDKEGGEPVTENIVFADPAAKFACVAKFDTNGDGEVSIEEAEAATSFGGLFTNWKGVVSFDEIRYFKNVHSLSGVFSGCNKLVSITVPENITDLGMSAFSGCSSLTSVVLPSGITAIGNSTFYSCSSLTAVDIPLGVNSISDYSFENCSSLSSVGIPSSVTSIGKNAFCGCSSLTQVVLPNGVTSIPDYCFMGCSSLTSVTVPSGVTSIGTSAFSGVEMWKIELPSTISSLGLGCFTSITCIILPSTSPVAITSGSFGQALGIFVPSNLIDMYSVMTNWVDYASKLHPLGSYKDKNEFTFVTSGAVDMGTSVKWAAYNLGATKPEECGGYYAWGEIQTKSSYNWNNYSWSNGDEHKLTKYCPVDKNDYWDGEGTPDGKTVLDLEDDAAHTNWGETWRMPTVEEWTELRDNCLWEWITYEGINGYQVYGFGGGNILFLPAAGRRYGTHLDNVGSEGHYWTPSLDTDYPGPHNALYSHLVSNYPIYSYYCDRSFGFTIRPVCD